MRRLMGRKVLAWLLVAAVIAHPWLGPMVTLAVAAAPQEVMICTRGGFKSIVVPYASLPPDTVNEADQDPHRQDGPACLACLAQALGSRGKDAALSILFSYDIEARLGPPAVLPAMLPRHGRSHPTRAPPGT